MGISITVLTCELHKKVKDYRTKSLQSMLYIISVFVNVRLCYELCRDFYCLLLTNCKIASLNIYSLSQGDLNHLLKAKKRQKQKRFRRKSLH
jgi:hypothetical protein